ncbi:hypothetical protein BTZ05_15905 [Vibrio parahaemolyticus]|nr:hypothetical protein BTZ05_15905 [Vibrio parahaemolyticus]
MLLFKGLQSKFRSTFFNYLFVFGDFFLFARATETERPKIIIAIIVCGLINGVEICAFCNANYRLKSKLLDFLTAKDRQKRLK